MTTVMEFMGKDHDRLDKIFESFQNTNNLPEFEEFNRGLRRHIVWEEETLFPLFEEKTGMLNAGPAFVMRQEHMQIKEILDKINSGQNSAELQKDLLHVLTHHNMKEENMLYPWIDNSLSDDERIKVLAKLI